MFKFFMASLLVTVTWAAQAAPIFVRNGAGRSEYSLVFSRLHLTDLLSVCLQNKCALTLEATRLLNELVLRSKNAPQPLFTNRETDFAGTFTIDLKANTVTFKQSAIWKDAESQLDLNVADSVLVWMDVLVSLAPINTQALAELKGHLSSALSLKVTRTSVDISPLSTFEALALKQIDDGDRLFVRDASLVSHDLTPPLVKAIDCKSVPEKVEIKSMRWGSVPPSSDAGDLRVPLEATASWTCAGRVRRSRFRLVIVSYANEQGLEVIDAAQTRVYGQGE